MRVALFAPYLPAPAFTGGRIRIHELARALSRSAELHLFAQAPLREVKAADAREALGVYASVEVVQPHVSWPRIWGRTPVRVRRAVPRALATGFAAQHARAPFDLIVVEHCHAAAVARRAGLPWLLDEHNVESQYLAQKLSAEGPLRCRHHAELARLRAWEVACWREATEVVAVTPDDAACIAAVRGSAVTHIPNGVGEVVGDRLAAQSGESVRRAPHGVETAVPTPVGAALPALAAQRGKQVLFVGLMDHPPNVRAAQLLATEVMPRVWRRCPEATLVLCGANPSRAVRALAGKQVLVTGRVPSVGPYYAAASAFASCLQGGAGSSLKVLEALAAGVPLVSTAAGVRGFALSPQRHYLPGETPDELATAILRCLSTPAAAELASMRDEGRMFAAAHRWSTLASRFAALALQTAEARS
ncbi:MAG: glycosyltransferase [Polyangiales bacterium]